MNTTKHENFCTYKGSHFANYCGETATHIVKWSFGNGLTDQLQGSELMCEYHAMLHKKVCEVRKI